MHKTLDVMKTVKKLRKLLPLGMLVCAALLSNQAAAQGMEPVPIQAAVADAQAQRSMMLAAAQAGERVVAVGARGLVILSDDGGQHWRQARQVPVDFTLTAVSFSDDKQGWAVGHGGVVIHTADGGETWQLQRSATDVDQPLFTVYFRDSQHGWAAGLWSLLLQTADGGKTWTTLHLPMAAGSKRNDLNLLHLFPGQGEAIYLAAEQGTLYHSADAGQHWDVLATGSKASLWSGVLAQPSGTLIVAGLGGKLLRSTDAGANWQTVSIPTSGSITTLQATPGLLTASSLEGKLLQSRDDGVNWQVVWSSPQALTTVLVTSPGLVLPFSKEGALKPVAIDAPKP
ncbi:WD40/YVTN/BNR-like repeat-containing protein [Herbaspirillum sp. B65]|uniref:WD40/YVTN/BNR-like repeat-containing protein n=1 Tax=Herbaspirillum sp. B65 TaxID=137708 RepID=UPI0005C9D2BA|nr:YCF48-related protein [Herbaspirillum sp. B65]